MSCNTVEYNYNASALGIGGVLLKKRLGDPNACDKTFIPSLASVALAPTGGQGVSEVSNYSKDGIAFRNAKSEVTGEQTDENTFTTTARISITGLNLFDRVTVESMTADVSSTRKFLRAANLIQQADPDGTCFVMHAAIAGLTVDGEEVVPQFDVDFLQCGTFRHFIEKIRNNVPGYARRFGVTDDDLQQVVDTQTSPLRGTIVETINVNPSQSVGRPAGFTLPVKGFGKIHLGELIVKPGRRRLNMLRIDFNSSLGAEFGQAVAALHRGSHAGSGGPDDGSMTILSEDSNGSPIWPPSGG